MPNARTSTTKKVPADARADALARIIAHALTLPTQAAIADVLGVSGKTLRNRSRTGTHKHADGNAVPAFRASKDGAKPPARVVEGIVYTFAPQDDAAVSALADKVSGTTK